MAVDFRSIQFLSILNFFHMFDIASYVRHKSNFMIMPRYHNHYIDRFLSAYLKKILNRRLIKILNIIEVVIGK